MRASKRTLSQISVRLSERIKEAITSYAGQLEIDVSALINLLVLRETWLQRLAKLRYSGPPKRLRQQRGMGQPVKHVTVYFGSLARTTEFENYAASCGLKPTDALAWLIEKEIDELWLQRALRLK